MYVNRFIVSGPKEPSGFVPPFFDSDFQLTQRLYKAFHSLANFNKLEETKEKY